jgi:hypothetical protein
MRLGLIFGGALAAAVTVASATATAAASDATEAVADITPVGAVIVVAEDIDRAELVDAFTLRAPQREVLAPGGARPAALFAVAEVRQKSATVVGVVVILSDGRLYRREVEAEPDVAPRVAASALEHLLAGIEEDRIVADEHDAPLPADATAPEPAPPESGPSSPPPTPPPRPRPAMADLGVLVHGGLLLGLPPTTPSGYAGGGGGLDVRVRWPRGLVFGAGVRVAGQRRQGVAAVRLRPTLEVGYAWRRRWFELVAVAGPDLEAVFVRRDGRPEVLTFPDGQTRGAAVGLGGHVQLAPGARVFVGRSALRVGPRLELAGSGLSSGGIARLNTADDAGARTSVLRVGGLEASVGLEVGGWFSLSGNRGSASPRASAAPADPTDVRR